jgi:protein-S-isoprenylcysteine O-methyltransferase Ste14
MTSATPSRQQLWRNIVFVILVPGVVAGLIPWLITGYELHDWGTWAWVVIPVAAVLIAAGSAVLLYGVWRFATEGRGTPAPVAPTQELVIGGPYRYVRNPMYLGVGAVIIGQALLSPSWAMLAYTLAFGVAVFAFVRLYEEPTLHRTFGEQYAKYVADVPGWWPRRPSSR